LDSGVDRNKRGSALRHRKPVIVGVGGTLRIGSTSERALAFALAAAAQLGASTEIFSGPAIALPAFDPAEGERGPEAKALVAALRRADGVIFSSPSYHGSVSGLLKNAIDYVEDMRSDARVYLADRAVGIIVCADGIQAMGSTLASLRAIAHALRGWPTPFAAVVNSGARPFGADGACRSAEVEQSLRLVAAQVVEFARMRLGDSGAGAEAGAERAPPSSAELAERMAQMEMTFRLMG
jgi:FMN reductase